MEGAELVELLRASAEESDREAIVTTSPRGCPVLVPAGAPPGGRWQAVAYVGQETLCYSFWCGWISLGGTGGCACCCPEPRMWRDFRFVYVAEGKQWTEGGPSRTRGPDLRRVRPARQGRGARFSPRPAGIVHITLS